MGAFPLPFHSRKGEKMGWGCHLMCFAPDPRVFQPRRYTSQLVLSLGAPPHTRAMCVASFRLTSLLPPSLSFGGMTRQRRHSIRRPLTKAQSAACELCTCEPGHVRDASNTGDQPTTPPMCLNSSSRLPSFPLDSNSLAPAYVCSTWNVPCRCKRLCTPAMPVRLTFLSALASHRFLPVWCASPSSRTFTPFSSPLPHPPYAFVLL